MPLRPRAVLRMLLPAILCLSLPAGCGGGGGASSASTAATQATAGPGASPGWGVAPPELHDVGALPSVSATPDLIQPASALHNATPIDLPMHLVIDALGIDASVAAVGLTKAGAMDAPEGPLDSPVWQEAFWYRGGTPPGQAGVSTFAGHVDDTAGRPAAFAAIRNLVPGGIVRITDRTSGADLHFRVSGLETYNLQQLSTIPVLTRMFGADAVAGRVPQPAADGVARLVLITCTGRFVNGQYDHRLVVYAERV